MRPKGCCEIKPTCGRRVGAGIRRKLRQKLPDTIAAWMPANAALLRPEHRRLYELWRLTRVTFMRSNLVRQSKELEEMVALATGPIITANSKQVDAAQSALVTTIALLDALTTAIDQQFVTTSHVWHVEMGKPCGKNAWCQASA